ncbi:protein mono-ADP-ribosyltransferase PARP14 isoform X1 [Tympanuchus pallidicinctus]|uniref:protein mono-ADP-ribosyltransferase PARP14 isoform X1 n=1 Tax=Tympanuchus pallidicinctus TaxID=109042 RepID=UPI00228739C4|nr:protein mono-ADP-ribosyltransferase PARP14 isoform X1 [Tympanuchus pallidicinctus]
MAGPRPGSFPLLVRGDWGTAEPPAALRKKLLLYFQSPKRSGGGECELRGGPGQLLVCFAQPDVKQQVLERQTHELDLGKKGKFKFIVTELEAAAEQEALEEKIVPTKALDAMRGLQRKGGALQKTENDFPKSELQERSRSMEKGAEQSAETSPSVVLGNVEGCSAKCIQILLEDVGGLAADDDFTVEMIPELNVAVATFLKSIDTQEFINNLAQNKRVKRFKITARLLEVTRSLKAENIPDNVSTDYLTVYFENTQNGGGPLSDIQLFPEENSAIVTFCDHKDLSTVLEKQHLLQETPVSVHPYYHSLGTALYGKDRPVTKMPDSVVMPLDPYVWQFLQRQDRLTEAINQEMANCHCCLKWPQADCAQPEITLCPSSSISEQKETMIKLIKTWKQDVSTEFSRIMSRYVAIKCKVSSAKWKEVKNRLVKDSDLIITDISEEMVVIAGNRAAVDSAEKKVRECMEKAMEESERKKQTIEISVSITPGKYAVLHNAGLEKQIHEEYPRLKISYDETKQTVQLCGLSAEVYKTKANLLEKVLNMPSASVNVNNNVFLHLRCVNSKTMSEMLFAAHKINAFYELKGDTVVVFGETSKDLSEGEKRLKASLAYKSIDVKDSEVTKMKEWSDLLAFLRKKYPSSQETVVIHEPIGNENTVIVTGFTETVEEVYQNLYDFIDRNTQVEKEIPAKLVAAVEFIEKEKSAVCDELRNKGGTVCFHTKTPCISLCGPKAEVSKAATVLEKIISSLYWKDVSIDKPGAKQFFVNRKDTFIFEAKQKFNCLIRLKEEEQQKSENVDDNEERKLHYRQILQDGVEVLVYKGNLCNYPVDVVVNASNEDLKHIGGLAWALLQAAGPELQAECDEVVKKRGSLQAGCAVITGAGKLPCKQVIHAVGPRWKKKRVGKCVYLLRQAIKKSLQLADKYNHRSIAFPSVSGGIFGFPLRKCVNAIVSAIKKTLEEFSGGSSLKEIHLVAIDEETVQVLSETVQRVFRTKLSTSVPQQGCSTDHRQWESESEERGEDLCVATDGEKMITTAEGLCIRVEEKDIVDATTDVIVNSVGTDLGFGVGPLCRALLEEAGPELQVEFDKEKGQQAVGNGSVLCTSGCTLACKFVFHAVLSQWDRGSGQALKTLENIVNLCLMKTEELGLNSITFPAIGTGGFRFPKTVVSKLMFDEVFKFSSSHSRKTLQEVHFLLHPDDMYNIQAFTNELKRRVTGDVAPRLDFISPVSTEALGVYKMKIGSIMLKVISGDITKEDTEVIVNISNRTFDATSGVFKAIMDAAGSDVEEECDQYAGQLQSGFITTEGGALSCSKIIHLIHSMNVKNQVSKVLHECELRSYKSVAFPAIGTGAARQNPAKVADDMLDAIVEFASSRSVQHLKEIKIVIFQEHMLRDFYESMKREDLALFEPQSWMSTLKSCSWGQKKSIKKVLEKKVDKVTFQICGESKRNVDATESWIVDLILKEQFENTIVDELIENFDERQIEALADLQRGKHVTIQLDKSHSPPCITISGISREVCSVSVEVQKMIKKIMTTQEEQSKAELVYNLVEWRYQRTDDSFVAFDKLTNMQLEDAKIDKKTHLTIRINKNNYRVDLNTLQALNDQGRTINIQRVPKNEDMQSIEFPAKWEDMQGERVKLVALTQSCQEYLEVQKRFQKTAHSFVIEKIQRIQNPFLWQTYQIKKKSLCMKNKHKDNEKLLFHGTAKISLNAINYNGFNRGFAGINAAIIGNGTYFAVNANYSAQDIYSKPDTSGRKYMYLARVLTGEFCVGSRGLVTPPPKHSADPTNLYDSVVDDENSPKMFVIFNDIQAYPEYLITFRQ